MGIIQLLAFGEFLVDLRIADPRTGAHWRAECKAPNPTGGITRGSRDVEDHTPRKSAQTFRQLGREGAALHLIELGLDVDLTECGDHPLTQRKVGRQRGQVPGVKPVRKAGFFGRGPG